MDTVQGRVLASRSATRSGRSAVTGEQNHHLHHCLDNITFTIADIQKAISELRMNYAAGPDGVPSILLLKCKEALAHPLYKIWCCSLDTGIIPTMLKEAGKSRPSSSSLLHSGPRLFNALPKNVRDTTGCPVSRFKKALDHFLQTLSDEPPVPGYTA
ncbi:hypothetical protein E2C01_004744 [Portunus trituberculatus]|uniref:Uncharacterized protein n=1 Tax=Portunus trituberculatus TaxID=210409 RepID=A0A5B7CUR3_PORTR|nr:hypothetical protein [Portunus trituberculatus]